MQMSQTLLQRFVSWARIYKVWEHLSNTAAVEILALIREAESTPREGRRLSCIFCGELIAIYQDSTKDAEKIKLGLQHQAQCSRNPHLRELTSLRAHYASTEAALPPCDNIEMSHSSRVLELRNLLKISEAEVKHLNILYDRFRRDVAEATRLPNEEAKECSEQEILERVESLILKKERADRALALKDLPDFGLREALRTELLKTGFQAEEWLDRAIDLLLRWSWGEGNTDNESTVSDHEKERALKIETTKLLREADYENRPKHTPPKPTQEQASTSGRTRPDGKGSDESRTTVQGG